jgi:hypothetical protein
VDEHALEALRRWEQSGASWALRSLDAGVAQVDLISCDGGELMGHLVSSEPDFVAYVVDGQERVR